MPTKLRDVDLEAYAPILLHLIFLIASAFLSYNMGEYLMPAVVFGVWLTYRSKWPWLVSRTVSLFA